MTKNQTVKKSSRSQGKSQQKPPLVKFRKTTLSNGISVLTENHHLSRAVSCGIWVKKGTRDEGAAEAGLAHFIEHMVFKRTAKRNAYEISRDMEAVGGELNAFTSREYTCFVTHSLKEHVGLSLDVLSDLVCRPKFDLNDIKKEKQVVIQEIHMADDQLEDCIFDRYLALAYPSSTVGKPILGTVKSISGMAREKIIDFHARQYTDANLLVTVSGHLDHDEVVGLIDRHLKTPRRVTDGMLSERQQTEELKGFRSAIRKPSEQAHVLVGFPASDFRSTLKFEGSLVNTVLGGGMTSRLYQKVREERGLVYSIYSQLVTFVDSGLNLIYAGTEPKKAPEVVDLTVKEIKRLKKNGLKKSELEFYKTQIKGQILLGADDIENRMNSLAINEMIFGKYRSIDDVIYDIEKISLDSVHEYIDTFFDLEKMGIMIMGAVPEAPTRKWLENL